VAIIGAGKTTIAEHGLADLKAEGGLSIYEIAYRLVHQRLYDRDRLIDALRK
jgi:hypothetical protein